MWIKFHLLRLGLQPLGRPLELKIVGCTLRGAVSVLVLDVTWMDKTQRVCPGETRVENVEAPAASCFYTCRTCS